MKIGIIGGGAAGLMAAIVAKNDYNDVTILEANNDVAKKIMITGNGKCNFWNSDQDLKHYYSNNANLIDNIIKKEDEDIIFNIFDNMGLIYKEKNGYYYPFSNQAITIKNMFLYEINRKNINIINNYYVNELKKDNDKFIINNELSFDAIVLATGSKCFPKTGSTGFGYELLKKLGHHIYEPLPSLTNLKSEGKFLKLWNGIRTDALVSLYVDDKLIKEEYGEIQLTDYGVSGICIYNLSGLASKYLNDNKKVSVKINFLPFIDCDYIDYFNKQTLKTGKNIYDLIEGVLNYKLLNILVKNKVLFTKMNLNEQKELISNLTSFELNILNTGDFNECQVCLNGLDLNEVNLNNMESKIIPNLFIVGELLDLTGDCGGYNLGIAFRTGLRAGRYINDKSKTS